MPPAAHLDVSTLDLSRPAAGLDAIRALNPQRFEMEQLTAVVMVDHAAGLMAGYRDVAADEFWCRGHMPGYPLMPGVIMIEAAAQLCSYFTRSRDPGDGSTFIALGGVEDARFRAPVRPGDRLVIVSKVLKHNRRQTTFNAQGFVGTTMAFEAGIVGVYAAYPKTPG